MKINNDTGRRTGVWVNGWMNRTSSGGISSRWIKSNPKANIQPSGHRGKQLPVLGAGPGLNKPRKSLHKLCRTRGLCDACAVGGTHRGQQRLHVLVRVCDRGQVDQVRVQHLLVPMKTRHVSVYTNSPYLPGYEQHRNHFSRLVRDVLPGHQ